MKLLVPIDYKVRVRFWGDRLCLQIFFWPFGHIHLDEFATRLAYAQFLLDARKLHWAELRASVQPNVGAEVAEGSVVLELPVRKPDQPLPVVELF